MALTRINNQALTNVTSAGLPSGTVLQVKTFKTTTKGSISGAASAWGDILTGSITPNSTSSVIYITGHTMLGNPAAGGLEMGIKIVRGSTDFFIGDNGSNNSQTEATLGSQVAGSEAYLAWTPSWHCYDTPNTTSAVTYKLQAYGSEGQNINLNEGSSSGNADYVFKGITSLILMEIAG